MAGHRPLLADGNRKPRRQDARAANRGGHRERVHREPTAEGQFAAAYNWFTSAAAGHRDRAAAMHRVATLLANEAAGLERSAA
jgi:hypothetical protein